MHLDVAEQLGIDSNQIASDGLTEKEFPVASVFRVVISEAAHQKMWGHARSTLADGDLIKEVGGILVGNLFRDEKGPYLEVTAAIVAEHTRNEGTEVAFTPQTWAQVNRVKDADHPTERIVGWYHTHPNFGIFLSERDQFLHRHSFPQPWAVAHVIDPVQNLEGLFVWKAGEPRDADEYWVGAERRSGRSTPHSDTSHVSPVAAASTSSRASWLVPSALSLVFVLMITIVTYARDVVRSERDKLIVQALESEKVELDRAFQILRALRAEVERVSRQSTSNITELKGQSEQLEGGLNKLNTITRSLQRRVQGIEENERSAERGTNK